MKSLPSAFLAAILPVTGSMAAPQARPNIVFIAVDDLRPELPCYGASHIHAPNIDRLAARALTFRRAYVQQGVCQPSRESLITGTRPDTTRIYDVFPSSGPTFRDTLGAIQTLPEAFKAAGYSTAAFGKITHHADPRAWDECDPLYKTENLYQLPENRALAGDVNRRPPTEAYPDAREAESMDARIATETVRAIRRDAASGRPFFIAAGFYKPHLPFSAPQKFWDLYDPARITVSSGRDALPVRGLPDANLHDPYSGELGTYRGGRPPFVKTTDATRAAIDSGTFTANTQSGKDYGIITVDGAHIYPADYARRLTHGYYACVSFIDAQIGRILDALEDPNGDGDRADSILDKTIIVLWGDNGFHLGDHGSWPKHTNLEISTRCPLLVAAPGRAMGRTTGALVEALDIYPTLLDLAGLPHPATHTLEGQSLKPVLDDPALPGKAAAISQYPREIPPGSGRWSMGYAMRTPRFTYIQWREMEADEPLSLAKRNFRITPRVRFEELYDNEADPKQNTNLAGEPSHAADLAALRAQFTQALPERTPPEVRK